MTVCVGWPGPCATHGHFHGCNRKAPHNGNHHQCDCGAETDDNQIRKWRYMDGDE